MVDTIERPTTNKADLFKGQADVGSDLLAPYVGTIIEWDVIQREGKKFGSEERVVENHFQLTIDPLDTAYFSPDGMARPSWKMSVTKQGKVVPGSTYAVVLESLAKGAGFALNTSADMDKLKGSTMRFGQIDPTKDERFAKVKADFRAKMKPVVVCWGKPEAGWENDIPADLDAQKIAKMAEAAAAREAKRQSQEAGQGETVTAQVVTTETAVSYDIDPDTATGLVEYLDGKDRAKIGMIVYQDKALKAAIPADVYKGLQDKTVQAHLAAMGLLDTTAKDGLYHSA